MVMTLYQKDHRLTLKKHLRVDRGTESEDLKDLNARASGPGAPERFSMNFAWTSPGPNTGQKSKRLCMKTGS